MGAKKINSIAMECCNIPLKEFEDIKCMPNNCYTKSKRIHRKMKLISQVGSRLVFLDENDRQLDITLNELSISLEVGKTYDLELEY